MNEPLTAFVSYRSDARSFYFNQGFMRLAQSDNFLVLFQTLGNECQGSGKNWNLIHLFNLIKLLNSEKVFLFQMH